MNELCFQLRRDQRKQRTVSHLSFSLRRDFPVRFDPRFFPSPPPNTYAARTFPKTRSIFREARFHYYYPCTVAIRFTNNAHSLSLTDKNPLPPSLFTEPTIEDWKKPTTLAVEVSIVFSSRGARKTLTRRAHSLVLNFFHFSRQSLHARMQPGRGDGSCDSVRVTIRTGCGRPTMFNRGERKKSLP